MEKEHKFYELEPILAKDCQYNIIFGERSNGKTYACLKYALVNYCKNKEQSAYIRRWKEDFRGKRGQQLYAAIEESNLVRQLTNDEWERIIYRNGKWHLAKDNPILDKTILDEEPFMFAFSLNDMEHDKSVSYPKVTTVIFDEFLSRQYYLNDEFVLFMNVLSTIIRHRNNVKIFMLGNTVNKYCPYFTEMGLSNIPEMPLGQIDVYQYGDGALRVAVERCGTNIIQKKKSDVYFAFDNPKLNMITGGAWEMNMYPHLPFKYRPIDILFIFFIVFNDNILQCECINCNNCNFLYIHYKTTPIKNEDTDIIFSCDYDPRPNHYRNIRRPIDNTSRQLASYFKEEQVFFQSNEVGEIVRNYMLWCAHDSGYIG